jgi:hypothetical protein
MIPVGALKSERAGRMLPPVRRRPRPRIGAHHSLAGGSLIKTTLRFIALFATVALIAASFGCGGAKSVGSTLYQQVGGADGCGKLANQFGANIKANPALNQVIDAGVMTALQSGLTNDIMRASNMAPTSDASLTSALKGTTLDANAMAGLSNALTEAGASLNLGKDTVNSLTGLLKPAAKRGM